MAPPLVRSVPPAGAGTAAAADAEGCAWLQEPDKESMGFVGDDALCAAFAAGARALGRPYAVVDARDAAFAVWALGGAVGEPRRPSAAPLCSASPYHAARSAAEMAAAIARARGPSPDFPCCRGDVLVVYAPLPLDARRQREVNAFLARLYEKSPKTKLRTQRRGESPFCAFGYRCAANVQVSAGNVGVYHSGGTEAAKMRATLDRLRRLNAMAGELAPLFRAVVGDDAWAEMRG
jgi:hypothetical protein